MSFGLQYRWLDWWVFELFTCCCVYFKFLGFFFPMWIWWFFLVYGFELLEVLVEDRDFVCILSIGSLNVRYFSVCFERKSWFSGENVDDCLRKIYEVGWVCCYCELGLCVFVSLENFWLWWKENVVMKILGIGFLDVNFFSVWWNLLGKMLNAQEFCVLEFLWFGFMFLSSCVFMFKSFKSETMYFYVFNFVFMFF